MNTLSFTRSAIVALLISVAISIAYFFSTAFLNADGLGASLAIRACLSAATCLYLLYLLKHADVSFGKLSVMSIYVVTTLAMLYWWPTLFIYSAINVGFIWLVRTVYYHSNIVFVALDFLACVISLVIAVAALMQSHSMFMCLWSFFLAQAFVLPVSHYFYARWIGFADDPCPEPSRSSQRFYQAHSQAEEALRKMA